MDENALVAGSKFEELLVKIHREKEELMASELNQNRRRDLLKSICSVYFFLRKVAGMARREMTLEEFEITEEKLKELAKEAVKKSRHRILMLLGFKTAWAYYDKFGYFHIKRTPFGNWYKKHGWFNQRAPSWNGFNPYDYVNRESFSLPLNAKDLLDRLFEKRFGKKSDIVEPRLY